RALIQLAKAEMAVSDEGAHPQLAGKCQCLAVVATSVLGAARRRDITSEAKSVGLDCPSLQPPGERLCFSDVDGGLVDPPSPEAGHPYVQRNERWPDVMWAMAELLNSARGQRERFVGSAGKSIGNTEGRSEGRCPEHDLSRSAEVEAPLEDPGRSREIPATEVGSAESEQSVVQRVGMVGFLSDPDRGLGVPDGLVEPAEVREHLGKVGSRPRRLDGGRPKARIAQLALERDVPLEQDGRIPELAPDGMRSTQVGRRDNLDRAIAQGSGDAQGFLTES